MERRSLRAARLATFTYFVLNGTLLGMWIVQIPSIEQRVGISHAVLGGFLLLLGAGAFVGMRAAGPAADRLGTRTVVPASAALCSAALVLPGLATGPWTLAGALAVLGFGNGCLDVSMNAHAVEVEKAYGRPVMSAFHATFSVGGVLAALAGAATAGWDWSPAATLGAAAVLGLVVSGCAAPGLLPSRSTPAADAGAGPGGPGVPGTGGAAPARIWLLAVLALLIMLCEGVANDWSVLHLRTVLGASDSAAAFAYGAFAAAMTVGRLLADRVSARFGPAAILRYGAAVAALGLSAAALSPWIPLALAGWGLFGAGLSGCVPQLFSAAGHADDSAAGANVSRVAGLGYLGMLAGPALIGWLTRLVPLNLAFFLPVACCVAAVAAAGVLRPRLSVP
ncbi:MFS transporter [Streptomyces shenzhenensis]|uniref:MFS transporter n=1 Tax=Streptomyces shenzhenensis TaxID=943815 RepID=UPI0038181175